MSSRPQTTVSSNAITRWKIARQLTLGSILLAAIASTAAVSTVEVATRRADRPLYQVKRIETYSGVGIKFTKLGEHFVINQVFANTPADGKILPGAILLSVDGQRGETLGQWSRLIRGQAGTTVDIELAYPDAHCPGAHQTVTLERAVLSIEL